VIEAVEALKALERGLVVAFPTETVWGLGARLDRPDGIERLFALKGRERGKPLQVMVASAGSVSRVARVPESVRIERLLPGPVSLVLRARDALPDLGATGGTVAVRVPDHPVALELLELSGPLATTSANRSGEPTPDTLEGVRGVFGDGVEAYLDGPPAPAGTASTVVDLTGPEPVVLRAGAMGLEEVREALGDVPGRW